MCVVPIVLFLASCSLQADSSFVDWVDSGFETGVDGLFDSAHKSRKSRVVSLLRSTEFADFDFDQITASSDGRQLRFWNYYSNEVVIVSPERTFRISEAQEAIIVLNDNGACIGTIRRQSETFVSRDGTTFPCPGPIWFDGSGSYVVTATEADDGSSTYVICGMARPDQPLVHVNGKGTIDVVKRVADVLYVCGRKRGDDPTGVWVERFREAKGSLQRLDYEEFPCPKSWGAVFSFVHDLDDKGRLLVVVEKRAPFVAPRAYYLLDPTDGQAKALRVSYGAFVHFLNRDAIRKIAARVNAEAATQPARRVETRSPDGER